MARRFVPFCIPTCDECIETNKHKWHNPDEIVITCDSIVGITRSEKIKKIKYKDYINRCAICYPR